MGEIDPAVDAGGEEALELLTGLGLVLAAGKLAGQQAAGVNPVGVGVRGGFSRHRSEPSLPRGRAVWLPQIRGAVLLLCIEDYLVLGHALFDCRPGSLKYIDEPAPDCRVLKGARYVGDSMPSLLVHAGKNNLLRVADDG